MQQKKAKKAKSKQITLRLNADELAPLDADRAAMPGVPVKRGAYIKHAALSFAKLRRIEAELREVAANIMHPSQETANRILFGGIATGARS